MCFFFTDLNDPVITRGPIKIYISIKQEYVNL